MVDEKRWTNSVDISYGEEMCVDPEKRVERRLLLIMREEGEENQ